MRLLDTSVASLAALGVQPKTQYDALLNLRGAPAGTTVSSIVPSGAGCPHDPIVMLNNFNETNSDVSFSFDGWAVNFGRSETNRVPDNWKECTLRFELLYPPGWHFSVSEIADAGQVDLSAKSIGDLRANVAYEGQPPREQKTFSITQTHDGKWNKTFDYPLSQRIWSPCGGDALFSVFTHLSVGEVPHFGIGMPIRRPPSLEHGFITFTAGPKIKTEWRRCKPWLAEPQTKPPAPLKQGKVLPQEAPPGVDINKVDSAGSGCPHGVSSVSSHLTAVDASFNMSWSDFMAQGIPNGPADNATRICKTQLQFLYAPGWQFTILNATGSGHINTTGSASPYNVLRVSFAGQSQSAARATGPQPPPVTSYNQNVPWSDVMLSGELDPNFVWSPCDGNATLNLDNSISLQLGTFDFADKIYGRWTGVATPSYTLEVQKLVTAWRLCDP